MTLEARTRALLELVEADRSHRCAALLGEAQRGAAETRARAHAEARERVRRAVGEERARAAERLAAAQARLQTHRRLNEQRRAAALLAAGWERLPGALLARWADPAARRGWVDAVLAVARAALRPGAWRVTHAAGLPEEERAALAAALAGELGTAPEIVTDAGLRAGLRIAMSGNAVDGTLEGLLADRAEVGARLLHALESTQVLPRGGCG